MELPTIREDIKPYAKLALAKAGYVAGQVEVCSACFQHCRACESWRDDLKGVVRGSWTLAQLQELCTQLAAMPTFEHLTLTGGDPQRWEPLRWFLPGFASHWRKPPFKLQCNTALTQEVYTNEWDAFHDVCVSLDAVDTELYQKIRGDKKTTPAEVLERMAIMQHRRLCTRTTVMSQNIDHMPELMRRLADWNDARSPKYKLRKAVFMAVIGPRDERAADFWSKFRDLKVLAQRLDLPSSFDDCVVQTRDFLQEVEARPVPCYAGNLSFHAKANGDWYPCCLAGGEAITTYPELRIGNFFDAQQLHGEFAVRQLLDQYGPACHYANPKMPCRDICQYKQLQVNLAGYRAAGTVLAMP